MKLGQEIKAIVSLLNCQGVKARADYINARIKLKDAGKVSEIQAIYPHIDIAHYG